MTKCTGICQPCGNKKEPYPCSRFAIGDDGLCGVHHGQAVRLANRLAENKKSEEAGKIMEQELLTIALLLDDAHQRGEDVAHAAMLRILKRIANEYGQLKV